MSAVRGRSLPSWLGFFSSLFSPDSTRGNPKIVLPTCIFLIDDLPGSTALLDASASSTWIDQVESTVWVAGSQSTLFLVGATADRVGLISSTDYVSVFGERDTIGLVSSGEDSLELLGVGNVRC